MGLTPVEEAQGLILGLVPVLPSEEVELDRALGAVLAEPLRSDEPVPGFTNSAMDGYAVRAADTTDAPVALRVAGATPAGPGDARRVGPGEAVRIMTGAPLPDGADAVVMVEHTRTEGGVVHVERTVGPGSAVRRPGEDVRVGDLVGSPGTELTPSRVALLASVGIDRVIAHRRPRVGVLATGDELVRSGGPLGPGQIRDSSSVLVRGLALESGADVVDLGMATDDEPSLHEAVLRGTDTCDVVVTTGGASVGDRDLLRVVIGELGVVHWLQVACKPAKPLVAGAVDGTPVLGLPGNPVSAMVAFELFARPTIRRLAGHTDLHRPLVEAVAPDGLARRRDGKVHYVRVVAEPDGNGRWSVRLAGGQRSHQLAALADANGLAVVPDGDGLAPGSSVPVMLLG